MILRTPPAKRSRPADANLPIIESPPAGSDGRLVIYEDPPPSTAGHESSDAPSEQLMCTYQCRQMVKSDFIDALSNAEKQVQDYQSKLETLNENFCKADAERKKFRDQFLYAEQELAAAKGREQVLQEQLLKEVNDSYGRLKKQLELSSELEVKFRNEMNLRLKAESSAASAEEKASGLEGKLSNLSENKKREMNRLKDELTVLKRESKFSMAKISADLERMECRATNAEKESELLKKQLEDLKQKLNECLHQKSEVEKKLSAFTFQEATSSESNILVKHLHEELRNYEAEVQEARKLRSSYDNFELLKEKLSEEKGRRERAELEVSKLQELQLNMSKLEDELLSWKTLIKDVPGVSCPEDIPAKMATLQKEVIDNMMKLGETNGRLKQMEVALDAAQLAQQNAETEAKLANEKAELSKSEVKRIEMMLSMVTEERDKLRNIVSAFKQPKNDGGDVTANQTLIQELESSVSKKESFIKELESNLHVQQEINNRQQEEIKLLNERLSNEARRIKSLEREGDRLRSEISLLESKLGHGDYSSSSTKVLRMVNTLGVDDDAKQTIEALRSELQKTKEKLQAVEELKSQSGDAGKLVDSYISGKITQLKEQIATLEKREERYKTVFADRISVFRRACCELFGYKIVMDERQRPNGIPVTRFTLQSIYSQSDDEKLEFEYESGNTNILGNDYTSQSEISRQVWNKFFSYCQTLLIHKISLGRLRLLLFIILCLNSVFAPMFDVPIEIFIRKMTSIPAFTANLTVESFNQRTLS